MSLLKVVNFASIPIAILIISIVLIPTSDAKFAPDTIQGMWTFEEGKGDTVKDLSGNGSDGVITGDLKWVDAKFGGGIEFSGVDAQNHIRIGTKT